VAQRVGIDLTSAEVVREAVSAHGDRYLTRVYTSQELVDCAGDPARLAGRFAAKEAAIKVLRPAPHEALPWSDIEVVREPDGHVELRLSGLAEAHAAAQGLLDFAVSLSHEGDAACAVVVAQNPLKERGRTADDT
jgi:holo-[acyl-carrier protein] synthase